MNWLTNFVKPKLSSLVKRRSVPEKLWNNCVSCGNMIHHKDLNENLRVCASCNYHFRMTAEKRIEVLFSKEKFTEIKLDEIPDDPLKFYDKKKYKDRLKEYRKKTGREDAFILGIGDIDNKKAIYGFAGKRIVANTENKPLNEDFQTAQWAQENGQIDVIVDRKDLKDTLYNLLSILLKKKSEVNLDLPNETSETNIQTREAS